jgi:Kef-type K+ transport system membrane component KefB
MAVLHDFFLMAIFMLMVYVAGVVVSKCKAPALVAHIGMGMLWMGAGWLPHEFAKPLEAVGAVGLMLMLFDGGVNMDIPVLKKMGVQATAVALSGVVFPMLMAWAMFSALGFGVMEGLACGSALASTGIGFTLSLMKDMGILATPLGQLVCAAAMIDDVSSMVLLAILKGATSLVETGEVNAFDMIKPVIASLGLFVGSIIVRVLLCRYMSGGDEGDKDVEKAEQQEAESVPYLHERILLVISASIGLALIADKVGSTHLLGCFLAGVIATSWKGFPEIWEPMVEPILPWMTMGFFACTVGFAVPVSALAAKDWTLVALVTAMAIISKVGTGFFAAKPTSQGYGLQVMQVGASMVGRGELGFMQISTAYSIGLVSLETYGATVWGLLVASICGPFMFRAAVQFAASRGESNSSKPKTDEPLPNLMQRPVADGAIKAAGINAVSGDTLEAL